MSTFRLKDKSEIGRDLNDNDLLFVSKTNENTDNNSIFSRIKNQITNNVTGITETRYSKTGHTHSLQEITNTNAVTTIESTFNGGLKTNRISPTGDTTTAVQINKADGTTSIINIDTVSGLTGFGITTPTDKIHLYGTDTTVGNGWNLQSNGIRLDGTTNADKDIIWADNGVDKWYAQIYRGENGAFWYLGNQEGQNIPLTVSQGGRLGVNKQTNFLDYHTSMITGSGLDDITIGGTYTKNFLTIYEVEIVVGSVTNPNTFHWRKSIDNGITYKNNAGVTNGWNTTQNCTTGTTTLENGVTTAFGSLTGHTALDKWRFGAFPQLPLGTFTIAPNKIDEVQTTINYSAVTPIYIDRTADANNTILDKSITLFSTGITNDAVYIGTRSKIDSIFLSLSTTATGVVMVAEYYNTTTSSWTGITTGMDYNDGTINLTQSGNITWTPSLLTNWGLYNLTGEVEYSLYWIRLRTTGTVTRSPIALSLSLDGDRRFSIFTGSQDYIPSIFVDSIGRMSIGGGNITGNNMLQINGKTQDFSSNLNVSSSVNTSLMELDSDNSNKSDFAIRLASTTPSAGPGFLLLKSRGTLAVPTNLVNGDMIGQNTFYSYANNSWREGISLKGIYTGNGTTYYNDFTISTANGSATAVEKMRVGNTGTTFFNTLILQSGLTLIVGSVNIYSGTASTRAAVRTLVGDSAPQGSIFYGTGGAATKPNTYIKVLNSNSDTDWERIVTQASD